MRIYTCILWEFSLSLGTNKYPSSPRALGIHISYISTLRRWRPLTHLLTANNTDIVFALRERGIKCPHHLCACAHRKRNHARHIHTQYACTHNARASRGRDLGTHCTAFTRLAPRALASSMPLSLSLTHSLTYVYAIFYRHRKEQAISGVYTLARVSEIHLLCSSCAKKRAERASERGYDVRFTPLALLARKRRCCTSAILHSLVAAAAASQSRRRRKVRACDPRSLFADISRRGAAHAYESIIIVGEYGERCKWNGRWWFLGARVLSVGSWEPPRAGDDCSARRRWVCEERRIGIWQAAVICWGWWRAFAEVELAISGV